MSAFTQLSDHQLFPSVINHLAYKAKPNSPEFFLNVTGGIWVYLIPIRGNGSTKLEPFLGVAMQVYNQVTSE